MTTVITLDAVRKRSFTYPVHYEASSFSVDIEDNLIARNVDFIIARNGDFIVTHHATTLGANQILKARKRIFTNPTVVIG
jgi:hypothetical protein